MWQLLIPAVAQILDKLIPDPQAKAAAQLELARMTQTGQLAELEAVKAMALAQAATNTAEASTGGLFRGGWRPFIGWICGLGLGFQYLMRPLLPWCLQIAGVQAPELPALDTGELMALVTGMLGLGGLRTFERVRDKA